MDRGAARAERRDERARKAAVAKLARSAFLFGLSVDVKRGTVRSAKDKRVVIPIVGAKAMVEAEGQALQRVTAGRLLAVGVFAFAIPKRTGRVVFVAIEGAGGGFSVEVPMKVEADALRWCREFNEVASGPVPAAQ